MPFRRSQRTIRRQAHKHLDHAKLEWFCTAPAFNFHEYGTMTTLKHNDFYYFKDNGGDILAVAHLDSVIRKPKCSIVKIHDEWCVWSPSLDDRLGAYVICELLPRLGVKCDVLLTIGEETGNSTAHDFIPPDGKQYNWIFSFDRTGTDVVMYDYETHDYKELVRETGARVGFGSFSDICYLTQLGVTGFNWGVGYRDYHSSRSHAWLNDTLLNVGRMVSFYEAHHETYMPYRPKPVVTWKGKVYGGHSGFTKDHGDFRGSYWPKDGKRWPASYCPHCGAELHSFEDDGEDEPYYWCETCQDVFNQREVDGKDKTA
jgi:hypothetical protein